MKAIKQSSLMSVYYHKPTDSWQWHFTLPRFRTNTDRQLKPLQVGNANYQTEEQAYDAGVDELKNLRLQFIRICRKMGI